MTLEDHALWASHDVGSPQLPAAVRRTLEDDALWLFAENKGTGDRNGGKHVHWGRAPTRLPGAPTPSLHS